MATTATKPKVRIKSDSKKLCDRIANRLNKLQPDNPDHGTFEHARSTEDSPTFIRYVVTTGIRSFDDRVGGMPIGKAVELVGLPQSGKTNMAVRTCVRAQQGFVYERVQADDGSITLQQLKKGTFNVTVIYYDNEGSLSDFNNRVVDGTLLDGEIVQCETVELLWKTMDGIMEDVDQEQENTGIIQFLLVVIDTVGSLTTKMELDQVWGKQDFARVPHQIKVGFKKMTARMQREHVMLLGLNHVSRRMGMRGRVAFSGWNYDSPGGMAFSYFATFQIFFETLQRKYCLRGKGEADGYVVYFMTKKNRLLPPLRHGKLALLFGIKDRTTGKLVREGGFKDDWSLLETIIHCKAAKVSETGTISFHFEKFGVPMTTFGPAKKVPTLEEQDDAAPPPAPTTPLRPGSRRRVGGVVEEPKKKDPRITNKMAWVEFYPEHKADLDALYNFVTDRALFGSESNDIPGLDDEEDEEEESED